MSRRRCARYVQTDIPEDRMIGLAWALRNFTPDHVERYVLDENSVSFGIGDDRWAEVADPSAIEALVRTAARPITIFQLFTIVHQNGVDFVNKIERRF